MTVKGAQDDKKKKDDGKGAQDDGKKNVMPPNTPIMSCRLAKHSWQGSGIFKLL